MNSMKNYAIGDVVHVTVNCLDGTGEKRKEKVHGQITYYDEERSGYDVKLEKLISMPNTEEVPYPVWEESSEIFRGVEVVKLNKIFVSAVDETLVKMNPEVVKALYAPLKKRMVQVFSGLTFRRVFDVSVTERFGDARIFGWEKNSGMQVRKATHKDIESIPFSSEKNFQKNDELIWRKRYMQEKGKYHGFTNKRALRLDDKWRDQSIYFNPKGYFELDCLNKGTWEWFRPHNDQVYQLPYQGDLICGVVKNGDKGPYFEKWFLCSEQFMKLVTLLLYPDNESVDKSRQRLMSRLKCAKFSVWLNSEEGRGATQDEIDARFHRSRYEQGSNHPYLYMWLGFLVCLGDDDVEGLEDAQRTLMQMSSYFTTN